MLIDCHTHSYTKKEIECLLSSMSRNDISKSVILYMYDNSIPAIESVIDTIAPYNNLFLVGSINITDNANFDGQLSRLEHAIKHNKIIGVKLYSGYEYFYANDPRCFVVYELCESHHLPVIFHTGDTLNDEKKALFKYANPIYIDEVAVKFPGLKILISHIGNPCWIDITKELIFKNKNVYTDISGILHAKKNRHTERYHADLKNKILELIAYNGSASKILFGTDYYYFKQEIYVEFIENFKELDKSDMDNIKYKNAERFFGI